MRRSHPYYRRQLEVAFVRRWIGDRLRRRKGRAVSRIVVGANLLFGDLVMAAPLIMALERDHPDATIDVLVSQGCGEFARHIRGVDDAIEVPRSSGRWLRGFLNRYHDYWDLGIVPFAYHVIPLLYAAGVPQVRSFPDPRGKRRLMVSHWIDPPERARHLSRLMLALSGDPDGEYRAPHFRLDRLAPVSSLPERYVVIHVGAGSPTRHWPLQNYESVANHLAAKGLHILLTGVPGEAARTAALSERLTTACTNLAGKTTPEELLSVVAHAGLIIGPDTGVTHLTRALARPTVVIMGPSSRTVFGIDAGLHDASLTRLLHRGDLTCREGQDAFGLRLRGLRTCTRRECLFDDIPCLTRTTVEEVTQAADELLAF